MRRYLVPIPLCVAFLLIAGAIAISRLFFREAWEAVPGWPVILSVTVVVVGRGGVPGGAKALYGRVWLAA